MNRQHITLADGQRLDYECIVDGVFAIYHPEDRRYSLRDEEGHFLGTVQRCAEVYPDRYSETTWVACPANGSDPAFFDSMYLAANWCRRTGMHPWIG